MPINSRRAHSPSTSQPIVNVRSTHQNATPSSILTERTSTTPPNLIGTPLHETARECTVSAKCDFSLTHLTIPRHSHARRRKSNPLSPSKPRQTTPCPTHPFHQSPPP